MYRLLRPLISLAFLAGSLWFAFSVKLGGRTFAEHVDRIGQTPEANDLIEGTRSTVNPVLQEATDRMLGEHIEAPTRAEPEPAVHAASARPSAHDRAQPGAQRPPKTSSPEHVKLPGQRCQRQASGRPAAGQRQFGGGSTVARRWLGGS